MSSSGKSAGGIVSGGIVMPSGVWAPTNDSSESNIMGAQDILIQPIYLTESIVLNGIGCNCTGAVAGSHYAVGLYSDLDGAPGALLVSNNGALFDTSTAGSKTLTGLSIPLAAGRYWAAALETVAALGVSMSRGYVSPRTLYDPVAAGATGAFTGMKMATGASLLPANAPALPMAGGITFGVPTLWLRKN